MASEKRNKRSISWCDKEHDVFEYEGYDYEDQDEIWFCGDDYYLIKQRSRKESKEWRRMGYGALLKETYDRPRKDVQDWLNAYAQLEGALTRRGLERQLSKQHGEERSELKQRARESVLVHQRRMKRQGATIGEIAEHLSVIYTDVTRSAEIFARRLGKADEYVVFNGEDNAPALAIVEAQDLQEYQRTGRMERRLSNVSMVSTNSFDSTCIPQPAHHNARAPKRTLEKETSTASPSSALEEYYAAIA